MLVAVEKLGDILTSVDAYLLFGTLLVAAVVQGMSGLGFSLVAAPVISQIVPGSQSIGLVNLLALFQNVWQIFREKGPIAWRHLRSLGIGLAVGVVSGLFLIFWLPEEARPLIVALSSLMSLVALTKWRPAGTKRSGMIAGIGGGSVNTYAGVGGPPLAAYLIRQGMDHSQYIRTLQVLFAVLNIVSIPALGLPALEWWFIPGALAVIAAGATLGIGLRQRISTRVAIRISEFAIMSVALIAAGRSLVSIFLA